VPYVSRFVERMLLAGAVWQRSDCCHGRWRQSRWGTQEPPFGADAGFAWINPALVQI
jgi:hypothetical protein